MSQGSRAGFGVGWARRTEAADVCQGMQVRRLAAGEVPALSVAAPACHLRLSHRGQDFEHRRELGRFDAAELPGEVGGSGAAGARAI